MRHLVIFGAVLLLTYIGPHPQEDSAYAVLWGVGLLLLLGLGADQASHWLRLPSVIGWLVAGLIVGRSGIQAFVPTDDVAHLVYVYAALWVGFNAGLKLEWQSGARWWTLPGLMAASTLATALLCAGGLFWMLGMPAWMALFMGCWAALWGPFTAAAVVFRREEALLNLLGAGFSLGLLAAVLLGAYGQGHFTGQAPSFVAWLGGSLALGAAWGGLLWGGRALRSPEAVAVALCGGFALAGLVLQHWSFFPLIAGWGTGAVLSFHGPLKKYLHALFEPGLPLASLVFFGLVGATIDLRILWPLGEGLVWQIVLLHVVAVTAVRGIGPLVWRPRLTAAAPLGVHSGWILMPKAALLFELVYHRDASLIGLFSGEWALLVKQVAVAEILLYGVFFAAVATVVWRLSGRSDASTA